MIYIKLQLEELSNNINENIGNKNSEEINNLEVILEFFYDRWILKFFLWK